MNRTADEVGSTARRVESIREDVIRSLRSYDSEKLISPTVSSSRRQTDAEPARSRRIIKSLQRLLGARRKRHAHNRRTSIKNVDARYAGCVGAEKRESKSKDGETCAMCSERIRRGFRRYMLKIPHGFCSRRCAQKFATGEEESPCKNPLPKVLPMFRRFSSSNSGPRVNGRGSSPSDVTCSSGDVLVDDDDAQDMLRIWIRSKGSGRNASTQRRRPSRCRREKSMPSYSPRRDVFLCKYWQLSTRGLESSSEEADVRLNPNDFVSLCIIGKGTSGVVHKAVYLPQIRTVAIKQISLSSSDASAANKHLLTELGILYSNLTRLDRTSVMDDDMGNYPHAPAWPLPAPPSSSRCAGSPRRYSASTSASSSSPKNSPSATKDDASSKQTNIVVCDDATCPHLVQFHGAYVRDAKLSLVMEFMDGGDLEQLVRPCLGSSLSTDNDWVGPRCSTLLIANFARRILQGLDYLHRVRHVVHRDLKPANVLLSESTGAVKISDYALCALLETPRRKRSHSISFVGTKLYMSPERLHGRAYSYPSDIWSLGILCLTLFLGRPPFSSNAQHFSFNLMQAASRGWSEDGDDDGKGLCIGRNAERHMTEGFRSFARSCLRVDPKRRPTARSLLQHHFVTQQSVSDVRLREILFGDHGVLRKRATGS